MESESDVKARDKADRLIKTFDGRALPVTPLRMNEATVCHDVKKFVSNMIGTLQHAKPYSYPFIASYNHLYQLKKLLDNEPTNTNNGRP